MQKAIFLDKDGTLIKDVPYNVKNEKVELLPFVGEGLRKLQEFGYALFVISNQSGIAKGYFDKGELMSLYGYLQERFYPYNVTLQGFYYCPHSEADHCLCRKPQPGLILNAAWENVIDVSSSWMIGDILHDVEAGNRAGCRTILINNGNETEWDTRSSYRQPTFVVQDFHEAVEKIIKADYVRSLLYG